MATDFSIPLQVRPPEIASPLQTIGGLMQLRGQMSEIALRNAQIETQRQNQADIQEQAQQRRRLNESAQKLTGLLTDPGAQAKFANNDYSPIYNAGIDPAVSDAWIKSHQEQLKATVGLSADKAAFYGAGRKIVGDNVAALQAQLEKDPSQADAIASQFNSMIPVLAQEHPELAAQLKPVQAGPDLKTQLQDIGATNLQLKSILDAHVANAKEEQATATSKAQADKENAAAAKDKFELDLMKGATAGGQDAAIDARFGADAQGAQAAKDAFRANLPGGVKAAIEAVNQVYENRIGAADKVRSEIPAKVKEQADLLPGEVKKAGAVAAAGIPAHIAEQVQTQQALAKLSPDAFASIPNPTSRNQAMNEADKIQQAYTDKLTQSQQLLDTINAAQKGNKAAPGVIPIEQVRSVLANGRINLYELRSVSSGAGSTMDRIEGWVKGHTEGQPIPPDILRDTADLAIIQQHAAQRAYQYGLDRLKMRGVDVSKIPPPSAPASDTGGPKKISSKAEFDALPSGAAYIDPGDGKAYAKP